MNTLMFRRPVTIALSGCQSNCLSITLLHPTPSGTRGLEGRIAFYGPLYYSNEREL